MMLMREKKNRKDLEVKMSIEALSYSMQVFSDICETI
jgi:hypothetical protein